MTFRLVTLFFTYTVLIDLCDFLLGLYYAKAFTLRQISFRDDKIDKILINDSFNSLEFDIKD